MVPLYKHDLLCGTLLDCLIQPSAIPIKNYCSCLQGCLQSFQTELPAKQCQWNPAACATCRAGHAVLHVIVTCPLDNCACAPGQLLLVLRSLWLGRIFQPCVCCSRKAHSQCKRIAIPVVWVCFICLHAQDICDYLPCGVCARGS